ncbi:MAG: sulfurtransferase-like selenium metabolism protein YedF [Clostridiales bacterium]|nr:sulfurtransferase-like selenium metabolism protein YedF [Clostridiales bacterium]
MAKVIDCRGLECPKPVIMTKKGLEEIDSGDVVTIVDNEVAKENVLKLAQSMGCKSDVGKKDNLFYITITKSQVIKNDAAGENNLVIIVASDKLGTGDDKLGSILMKSYMFALSESDNIPKTMIFLNSGVHLTTEDSPVLDSLKKLAHRGAEIMSCGTCLDYYGLKAKLLIGSITNMYTIVEKMNNAANTIKL